MKNLLYVCLFVCYTKPHRKLHNEIYFGNAIAIGFLWKGGGKQWLVIYMS